MAELTIGGRTVTVDDSFLSLSPEAQQATVDEIAQSLPAGEQQPQQQSAIPEGGIYDLPVVGDWLKSFSDTTGNFQTGFADTATLGTADEIGAGINAPLSPKSYDELVTGNRQALADSGTAGTMGQLAGAVMLPGGGWRTGAAQGAGYGFGSGEGGVAERLPGAVVGGALGGALGGIFGGKVAKPAAPTSKAMKETASEAYEAAGAAGTKAAAADTKAVVGDMVKMVDDEGLTVAGEVADWMPRVKTALKKFDAEVSGQEMTPAGMQKARKALQKVADSADESEARVGVKMLRQFDDFIEGKVPGFKDANQQWSRAMRAEKVEKLMRDVEIDTLKGGGLTKATRDRFAGLLHRINNGLEHGWGPAEIKAIEDVVKGKGGAAALETLRKVTSLNALPGQAAAYVTGGLSPLLSKGLDMGGGAITKKGTDELLRVVAGQPGKETLKRILDPRMLGGGPGIAGGALGSMFDRR